MLRDRWAWLRGEFESARTLTPSRREEAAVKLAVPAALLLTSAAILAENHFLQELLGDLLQVGDPMILLCSVHVLRLMDQPDEIPGLDLLAGECVEQLEANLTDPIRESEDWSIDLPPGCSCKLCQELDQFLADRSVQRLEWPINKEKRLHIHRRIDSHEFQVQHVTRRSGSPYTLVLTKTQDVFERERRQRERWRENLERLRR